MNWTATKEDIKTISKIVDRYMEFHVSLGVPKELQRSKMDIMMDLQATHDNGCPLDLDRLLSAKDGDFGHDVSGIQAHLNRETGQLEDGFLPRYARS